MDQTGVRRAGQLRRFLTRKTARHLAASKINPEIIRLAVMTNMGFASTTSH